MRGSSSRRGGTNTKKYNEHGKNNYDDDDDDGGNNNDVPPWALNILGPLANILLSDDYNDHIELQNRLRIYSLCTLATSTFFWVWACLNTLHLRRNSENGQGLDLGVVSFLFSALSSILLLRSAVGGSYCNSNNKQKYGCCGRKIKANDNSVDDGYDNNAPSSPKDHAAPGTWLRTFVILTQLIVSANYMLGVLFSVTAGTRRIYVFFGSYCFIFAILWIVAAYSGWVLMSVYRGSLLRAFGYDYLFPRTISLWRSILIFLTSSALQSSNYERMKNNMDNNDDYEYDEEEDEIDDELRELTSGRGYTY